MQKVDKTSRELPEQELHFDLTGIPHRLQDETLTLVMPFVMLSADLINEQARDDLKAAGLKDWEIERYAEEMMEAVQANVLAKMLQSRRK